MVPFLTDDGPTLETHNRQLLEAARTDNVELLTEIFAKHGEYDINFQDGWVLSWESSTCSCVANEGLFSIGNTGGQDT
jgi:hypothetical protein